MYCKKYSRAFALLCFTAILLVLSGCSGPVETLDYEYEPLPSEMQGYFAYPARECDDTHVEPIIPQMFGTVEEYLWHALLYGRNPTRGGWDGNVYTSRYMGMWFYMPYTWGWRAASDEELAEENRRGHCCEKPEMLAKGGVITDEMLSDFGLEIFDMMAANYETGASVSIYFTRFHYPEVPQIFSQGRSIFPPRETLPYKINVPGTIRIGAYYWHHFQDPWGSRFDAPSVRMIDVQRHKFINVCGLFARSIVIIVNEYSEQLDDILLMFGDINATPYPAPDVVLRERVHPRDAVRAFAEPPPANHPLLGTWLWDEDGILEAFVFDEDGMGTEFFGAGTVARAVADFAWFVDGNELIFVFGSDDKEVHTFRLYEDVLYLNLLGVGEYIQYVRYISTYTTPLEGDLIWEHFAGENVVVDNTDLMNQLLQFAFENPPPTGHSLIGTWEMIGQEDWFVFVFRECGLGAEYFHGWEHLTFAWMTNENELTLFLGGTLTEAHSFKVYDDVLYLNWGSFGTYYRFARK